MATKLSTVEAPMFWLMFACVHGPQGIESAGPVPMVVEPSVGLVAATEVEDSSLRAILEAAQADHHAWDVLAELCDDIGARLAGSAALADAVTWSVGQLEATGADAVWTEEVTVHHWTRGEESAEIVAPRPKPLTILGLGGTIAGDITADVALVRSLDALGPEVAGKIVLYDIPMEEGVPTVKRYGKAVGARIHGPSRAAAHGAVGALVRSVTTRSLNTPHTGATRYDEAHPRIPAAAVTTEAAASMARLIERGQTVRVRMRLGGETHADAQSHNVIAEIRGAEHPEEIILIGAHLDSWDVGQGAHDDGAGVVEVIETMRILRALKLNPMRTIRAVLFTNEENGLGGGLAYAAAHPDTESERHVAAIESDLGGGAPRFWTAGGREGDVAWMRAAAQPLGMEVQDGGGGADIKPLGERGTLLIGFRPDDSHYFDVHHTHADTVDKVDPAALAEATAAMAGLAWQLANAPAAPAE